MARWGIVVAAVLLFPVSVLAQPPSLTLAPTDPARWEVVGLVGWHGGNQSAVAVDWDGWYHVAAFTASGAFSWTPHVKTEASFASSREGRVFGQQPVSIPPAAPIFFRVQEHYFRTDAVTIGLQYQFGENQWVHPFVGAGLELARERHRVELPSQFIPTRDPQPSVLAPGFTTSETTYTARPVISAGLKFFVSDHTFIRTDVQTGFGRDRVASVTWRSGIGVEF